MYSSDKTILKYMYSTVLLQCYFMALKQQFSICIVPAYIVKMI